MGGYAVPMIVGEAPLEQAASSLRKAKRVVAFTGAGMSQESGIPTFRDDSGLWREFPPERFARPGGLVEMALRNPTEVARFLLAVLEPVALAEPNAGHRALAAIEAHAHVDVITQNIDRLHHDAGSRAVHEIHGSLLEVEGAGGEVVRTLTRTELRDIVRRLKRSLSRRFRLGHVLTAVQPLMGLGSGFVHRPRVVLFGEAMAEPDWSRAQEAAQRCDLMLMIGTSGEVWPAASLPRIASAQGAPVIAVNPDEIEADVWLEGTAGEVLPRLVASAFPP